MSYSVHRLKNGLNVIIENTGASKVMSAQIWVNTGSADECKKEEGLAHLLEHMLFKGTQKRGVGDIARDIENAGGSINAWTSFDETVFHITIATRYADRGLEVLSDTVYNPLLNAEDLKHELPVVLEEINMDNDEPENRASLNMFGKLFNKTPYAKPIIGYEKTVRSFTSRDIQNFYNKWYVPSNMALILAGNFDNIDILKIADKYFGNTIRDREFPVAAWPQIARKQGVKVAHSFMPVTVCSVSIGIKIPSYIHRDIPALDVLGTLLGQGASSRLEKNICRKKRLAYEIGAVTYTPKKAGLINIYAKVNYKDLDKFMIEIAKELKKLIEQTPSVDEVQKAIALLKGEDAFTFETVDARARKLGYSMAYSGDPEFDDTYYKNIDKIVPENIKQVARKYILKGEIAVGLVTPDNIKKSSLDINRKVKESFTGEFKKLKKSPLKNRKRNSNKIVFHQTAEGDTIIVLPVKNARTVAARAVFMEGQHMEPPGKSGILSLTSSLLAKGTTLKSAEEIATEIDTMPCSINGFSGRHTFGITGEFLTDSFAKGAELMAYSLLDPVFFEDEVQREKEILTSMIKEGLSNPGNIAFKNFKSALFGKHAYGRPIYGTKNSIISLDESDLKKVHKKAVSKNMVLAVCGNVDPEYAIDMGEFLFSRKINRRSITRVKPWKPVNRQREIIERINKEQSHIVMGFPGTTLFAADRYALYVLLEILGSQGGRLFDSLREKHSLVYDVSSVSFEGLQPGFIAFHAATSPGKERAVAEAIQYEINRIIKEPPSILEFERIKRTITGSKQIASQRYSTIAADMSLGYIYGLGYDAAKKYIYQIDKVKRGAVTKVAKKYFNPDNMVISCSGPVKNNLKFGL